MWNASNGARPTRAQPGRARRSWWARIASELRLLSRARAGTRALAALFERARDDAAMLPALRAPCDERAPLFEPALARAARRALMDQPTSELLETCR